MTAHPQNATYGAVCFALKRPYVRFATAVIVVGASFLLQEVMVHHIGPGLPLFITFYPAIMLVAILAGLWPGLLATALAALGVDYLILPPVGHFAIARTSDAVALAFFAAMSVFMSLVAEHYRRSQRSFAAYKVEQAMRRSADEARHASEYRQLAFDAAGLGTWEFVPETGGLSVDDNCRKLFGFQPDQAGANGVLAERIHPEDSGKVDDTVKRSIAGADGGLWGMDYRVVWPDSSIHWLTSHGRAYFSGEDDSRRAIRLIGVNMDITDRKRAEEELRNSELRYAGLFNSMDEGFCIIEMIFDPEGKPVDYRFLEVNAAFERQTGLHDAVGKWMRELAPSIETHWFENYGKVALDGEPIHFCHESKALSRYFEAGAYRVGEPEMRQVAVVFSDITERKRAEKHIRQLNRVYVVLSDVNQTIVREKHSQAMLEAACRIAVDKENFLMAWIGMVDPTTQTLEPVASSGLVDGYLDGARIDLRDQDNPNRLPGCAFQSGQFAVSNDIQNDPDYLPWRDDALRRGYRSAGSFPLKVDGRVEGVFNLYASEPGFFEGDELTLLTEMAMDISFALEVNRREEDRRRAEEELRWRTAFFEAQVDSALDGILVVDSQGKKILQNRRLNDLMKIPEDVSENADDAQQVQFVTKLMKDPEQFVQKVSWLYTHHEEVSRDELELHDGTIFERYSAPVMDKAQKHYGRIWRFRDITQQRQLEEQFRQAQKMEAVGQLTEGIAHDFNNLLTVILGCSEVLGEEVRQAPRLSKMADMISGAAQRGAELTHRMLAFARRQTLQPRPINVNRLLADMSSFLRRTLSADIELEIIPGGKVCEALVDPTQLESALLNLCVNARDAMPDGGVLTIETGNVVLDVEYTDRNVEVSPGRYILIQVSDTGSGISPENLPRVFDPFFTTKEVGKGTGLGLSMVYGFAKQSLGHVKIYSELGRGTTVKLFLPMADQKTETSSQHEAPIASFRGSEVILLVEDDAPVRDFAKSQLVDLGYRVLVAINAVEALNVIQEHKEIEVLFTDVVMPGGMNGHELASEACRYNPNLKILYCSGYAENAILHHGLLEKDVELLNKPYSRLELARRIRKVLAEG